MAWYVYVWPTFVFSGASLFSFVGEWGGMSYWSHTGDIVIARSQIMNLKKTSWSWYLHQQVRRSIVKQMMQYGYSGWNARPYHSYANWKMMLWTGNELIVHKIINGDALDSYLRDFFAKHNSFLLGNMVIEEHIWRSWSDIYLFKDVWDLQFLWYGVISYRTRENHDKEYRRFNIMTAFEKLGNVIVLNPGDTIDYLRDIHYDGKEKQNYQYWLSIVNDEEIQDYGGGICGSSTALYQWVFTNQWLLISKKNHSRRYKQLYSSFINGQWVAIPGIDSALYDWSLDLHITNTRSYPIVIVANYDGSKWWTEQIFTLSLQWDKGSFSFVRSYGFVSKNSAWATTSYKCYIRMINGTENKSCYKKVQ